jgi:hypothetical protein
MMTRARTLLEERGFDPYFIGDEISWRVTAEDAPGDVPDLTQTPQASRIDLFDAVTAYSLYSGGPPDPMSPQQDFENYPGLTNLVSDEVGLYRKYQQASGGRIPVIPDVLPGLNTRGVRLQANEHAQPRQWLPGDSSGSTLAQYLSLIARPVLDPSLPMVFVTSWNEWNEDTAIQPVGGVPTTKDNSASGNEYTQGYTYGGEGSTDLDVVRNFAEVAWGRVVSATGRPAPHVRVIEFDQGRPASSVLTDSEGWYVVPRSASCPDALAVGVAGDIRGFVCSPTVAQRVDLRT